MKLKKQLNNKGFSLVELLIATVILAIVVAPLLHTFVTASVTAARSRRIGDATLAGQNVAETVEASTLSQLINDPDPTRYFAGATSKGLYKPDASGYTAISPDAAGPDVYHLGVHGLQAGGSVFNAMVSFDAAAYKNAVDPEVNPKINDLEIVDYSNMDAVYAQPQDSDNPDEKSRSDFENKVTGRIGSWATSNAKVNREITLNVTETDGKIYASLDFDYEYTCPYTTEDADGNIEYHTGTIRTDTISSQLLPQGFSVTTNGRLPNVYLMYYPMYGEPSVYNDTIVINNDIAQPFKLFLVKERAASLTDELQYKAHIEQYVPDGTASSNYAVIYSNATEDLSNELNHTPLSGVTYKIYRGNWWEVSGSFAGEHGALVSKSSKNRLYDVTIRIYDSDSADFSANPLYTVHSTKLQ